MKEMNVNGKRKVHRAMEITPRQKVAGFVILGVATAILIVVAVGCAEKEKTATSNEKVEIVEFLEEPEELPEMSASAVEEGYVVEEDSTSDSFSLEAGAAAAENNSIAEADSTDVPEDAMLVDEPTSGDSNMIFAVSEEWTDRYGGLYAKIGDNFYSLTNELPVDVIDKYDIGYVVSSEGQRRETDEAMIYLSDVIELKDTIPSVAKKAIVTCGDFSPLRVHRNDSLAVFGDSAGTPVSFLKADFVGYTIPAIQVDQSMNYYPVVDHILPNNLIENHSGVFTLDETPVEDVRKLEYGSEYLYECYLGTEYREIKLQANSRCYTFDKNNGIQFTAEPTKFGYFAIDISSLEPGFYTYSPCNVVFEIVD